MRVARNLWNNPEKTRLLWGGQGREGSKLVMARGMFQRQKEEPSEKNTKSE